MHTIVCNVDKEIHANIIWVSVAMEYDIQSTNLRSETKRRQIYQIKYTSVKDSHGKKKRAYSRNSFAIRTKQTQTDTYHKSNTPNYTLKSKVHKSNDRYY